MNLLFITIIPSIMLEEGKVSKEGGREAVGNGNGCACMSVRAVSMICIPIAV
jgi:hypothetical protein